MVSLNLLVNSQLETIVTPVDPGTTTTPAIIRKIQILRHQATVHKKFSLTVTIKPAAVRLSGYILSHFSYSSRLSLFLICLTVSSRTNQPITCLSAGFVTFHDMSRGGVLCNRRDATGNGPHKGDQFACNSYHHYLGCFSSCSEPSISSA